MRPKIEMILMIEGIAFLLLSGIPAVLMYMNIQGFKVIQAPSIFALHWYIMIFGFFLSIIGNEILVALSMKWSGKTASKKLILTFGSLVLISVLLAILNEITRLHFFGFSYPYTTFIAILLLIYYSRVYLRYSRFGLKPTIYNYLIVLTLIITAFIVIFERFYYYPWLALAFPTLMIFAVMSRDIGLVFRGKIVNSKLMALAYFFILFGFFSYPYQIASVLFFFAWAISLYATGLINVKGILYPKICLNLAWIWLLLASIFSLLNYDAFIHSIALGFLFNTIFGVDVVLMDMLIATFGIRVKVKPSYIPVFLLNLGLLIRIIYDLGFSSPIFVLSAPLQGIGIISFFFNIFRQVFGQIIKSEAMQLPSYQNKRYSYESLVS
jgi:hypothetical protein